MMQSVSDSCEIINIPNLEGLKIQNNVKTSHPEVIRCNYKDSVLLDFLDDCFVVEDLETGQTVTFTFRDMHSASYKYDYDFEYAFRNAFADKIFILATNAALKRIAEIMEFNRISF